MTQMLTESGVLTRASLARRSHRQLDVWDAQKRGLMREQAKVDCALLWCFAVLALVVVAGAFELGCAIVRAVGP